MDFSIYKNKNILITGSTGLIGSNLIKKLLLLGSNVFAIARDENKAKQMSFYNNVKWYFYSLTDKLTVCEDIDYIIHTASPTDSNYFISNPVDTITSTISGLNSILELAKEKNIKSFLFTSSLEVYGLCLEDRLVKETEFFPIDCTNVRSSYSEGKRILECLCVSYGKQYEIPIKIVRLCQTFGEGVSLNDNRVFAQFAKSVINNNDIILTTKGESKRTYCSIEDAINGILLVLINGKNSEAYNIASDNSYYSIFDMAHMFADNNNVNVVINEQKNDKYLPTIKFGLDTVKIKSIGFESKTNLRMMIDNFIEYYRKLVN